MGVLRYELRLRLTVPILLLFNLTMYPTPESLGCPHVPPAPFAPQDSDKLQSVGIRLYTTASKQLYGNHSQVKSSELDLIYTAMDTMRLLEIRPAEWVQSRLLMFKKTSIGDRLPRAPVNYVFSTKALTEAEFFPGDLCLPRIIVTPATREFLRRWNVSKRNRLSLDWIESESAKVGEYNWRIQQMVNDDVEQGTFVWMSTYRSV